MKKYFKHISIMLVLALMVCTIQKVGDSDKADESWTLTGKIVSKAEREKMEADKPAVSSLSKPTNLKVYRSTEASMVSFNKVDNAQSYKIYRHVGKQNVKKGKKKWSGSWVYLGSVNEKDYTYSTYYNHVREYVDIRYKKNPKKYNYKKYYTYKVVAVNRNVESPAVTKYSTKWKMQKNELSYYTLYLTNKTRKKMGLSFLIWGHAYNKGSLIRAKELKTQSRKNRSRWHYRPNGQWFPGAFLYLKDEKSYIPIGKEKVKKQYNLGFEDVGIGYSGTTKDVYDGYMHSPGHKGPLVENQLDVDDEVGDVELSWNGKTITLHTGDYIWNTLSLTSATYCSNILKDKDVFHEAIIGDEDSLVNEAKFRNHK